MTEESRIKAEKYLGLADLKNASEKEISELEFFLRSFDWGKFSDNTYIKAGVSPSEIEFALVKGLYASEKVNVAGRLSINNIMDENTRYLEIVMAEGVSEANEVLKQLEKAAPNVKKDQVVHVFGGHFVPYLNTLLSLDDMNMRGRQIVYAAEYCDGNYQRLVELLQDRDKNLIAYVNKRTAGESKDFMDRHLAVSSGASLTEMSVFDTDLHFRMSPEEIESFRSSPVEKLAIDYSQMDILSGTDVDTAIKIAESYGFKVAARYEIPMGSPLDKNNERIIMYNEHTGDFLEAVAKNDDICYGGCRVVAARQPSKIHCVWRDEDIGVHGNSENFESGGKEFLMVECDYKGGVFRQYKTIGKTDKGLIDTLDLPLSGMVHLPILPVCDDHVFFHADKMVRDEMDKERDPSKKDFLASAFHLMYSKHYSLASLVNALEMPRMLDYLSMDARESYARWNQDKYGAMYEYAYASNQGPEMFGRLMRLAFVVAEEMHDEGFHFDYAAYEAGYKEYIAKIVEKYPHREREFQDLDSRVSFTPTEDDKYLASVICGKVQEYEKESEDKGVVDRSC